MKVLAARSSTEYDFGGLRVEIFVTDSTFPFDVLASGSELVPEVSRCLAQHVLVYLETALAHSNTHHGTTQASRLLAHATSPKQS